MQDLMARAERIARLLKDRRETIAVAESSTGGLISAALLAMPGASAYFLGGAVVYTQVARRALLELPDIAALGMRASTEPYARLLAQPRGSGSRRAGPWPRAEQPAPPAIATVIRPATAASRLPGRASARSRSKRAAAIASPTCVRSARPRSTCCSRLSAKARRPRDAPSQCLPVRLLRLPAVEHVLRRLERVVGLWKADIGRALQDGLDDLLALGAAIERAARVQRHLVGAIGCHRRRDHDQLARLEIEIRPVPDRAEAIFVDGAGMRRADCIELAPRLQPVLAEGFVANLLSAGGAILAHGFLPCVEVVAGAATIAADRCNGKRSTDDAVSPLECAPTSRPRPICRTRP